MIKVHKTWRKKGRMQEDILQALVNKGEHARYEGEKNGTI